MRLGIMQPYFLPYLGYYSLIKHTDNWIIFDNVQFIRHGWIERNRVLKPVEDWQYIAVPLEKHTQATPIKNIKIRGQEWPSRILRQLEHYKKAPYYNETMRVLSTAFNCSTDSIAVLDAHILKCTCNYLGIDFKYKIFSEMEMNIGPVQHAGDWALNISKAYRATSYINGIAGRSLFEADKFKAAGIKLQFLDIALKDYSQRRKTFEAGLSIVDVMMFNSVEEINTMLTDNTTITNE